MANSLIAEASEDFAAGAMFVPLDSIVNPGLVVAAIAQTLGVREVEGQPLLASVQQFLRSKQLRIVVQEIADKAVMTVRTAGGTHEAPVPAGAASRCSLQRKRLNSRSWAWQSNGSTASLWMSKGPCTTAASLLSRRGRSRFCRTT